MHPDKVWLTQEEFQSILAHMVEIPIPYKYSQPVIKTLEGALERFRAENRAVSGDS
jgi:hypothetical protein